MPAGKSKSIIPVYNANEISEALGSIGARIREKIEQTRIRAEEIMEEANCADDAWTNWDTDTLLQMGYITQAEVDLIETEKKREDQDLNIPTKWSKTPISDNVDAYSDRRIKN